MSDIKCGITLFSLAHPFLHRKLDLEGCLELVASCGYEGIELVSEQMVKGYPYPDDAWCSDFRKMMDRYGLEGYAYGCYVDNVRYSGRTRTADENFYAALQDLKVAHKLGFKAVKTASDLQDEAIIRLIPFAKELGVWIGFELHDPERFNDERWRRLFDIFDAYGPDVAGVVPDMGMFAAKTNKLVIEAEKRGGRVPQFNPYPWTDLEYCIPYSRYMHGKCLYINEQLEDESIDYVKVFDVLTKGGYKGALACEYEGFFTEADEDSTEQVRRYAKMFRKLTQDTK